MQKKPLVGGMQHAILLDLFLVILGKGAKTVLPSEMPMVKIDFRLIPKMDPKKQVCYD